MDSAEKLLSTAFKLPVNSRPGPVLVYKLGAVLVAGYMGGSIPVLVYKGA